MVSRSLRGNRKGQFIVLSALLIVMMMISVATLLASTSIIDVQLSKEDFRYDTIQVSSNFHGALTMALAEVSKELELRASAVNYLNYSTLKDYPEATEKGRKFMANWQQTILLEYTGRNLNLNISQPSFECLWNSSETVSRVSSNLSLDILTYGFYGWKETAAVELSLKILDLKESDGNITSFYIVLQRENNRPSSGLPSSSVRIFYLEENGTWFYEADPSTISVSYLGGGSYLVSFVSHDMATPPTIKIILQDERGIVVGAFPQNGVVLRYGNDTTGPKTSNVIAYPNPSGGRPSVKLTATIDDLTTGWSNIVSAEYFIDTVGSNGSGTPMSASDGVFGSLSEDVEAQLDVSEWSLGNYTLYVHGKDASGNWGNFSCTILEITSAPKMHVASIDMSIERRWSWRVRCRAQVTIVDSNGNPVAGAMVYGHWSGSVSGSVHSETGTNGKVTFNSDWISWSRWINGGSFTFTVDNVVKDGWIYDESSNVETSDTIRP